MAYIARYDIGGYSKGEEVPKERAELWMKMYSENPVEYKTDVIEEIKKVEEPVKKKPIRRKK